MLTGNVADTTVDLRQPLQVWSNEVRGGGSSSGKTSAVHVVSVRAQGVILNFEIRELRP